jgi:hypothetical protein
VPFGTLTLCFRVVLEYTDLVYSLPTLVILGQFFPEITEEEILYGSFQQDSATAHTACMSMQALSDVFRDKIISSILPERSLDRNSCDIYFYGVA